MWQESYESPQSHLWFGRVDQERRRSDTINVKLVDLASKASITTEKKNIAIVALIDEGVRRNKVGQELTTVLMHLEEVR